MIFKHSDFKKPKSFPKSLIKEGLVRDYYFFYLENGPILKGPSPVIIKRQNNKKESNFGELFIQADGPYWYDKQTNSWVNSEYYLVFKTSEELENEKEFILR